MSAERSRSLSHFAPGSTQTALSSLVSHIVFIFPVLLPPSDSSLGYLCYQVMSMAMKMWVDWWGAGVGWWGVWGGLHQSSLSCCWSREKSCKWLAVSGVSWPEAKDPHEGLNDHFWVGVLYTMWILFWLCAHKVITVLIYCKGEKEKMCVCVCWGGCCSRIGS